VFDRNGMNIIDMGSLREFGHVTETVADDQRMLEIRKKTITV
jgi:hypothetical protein